MKVNLSNLIGIPFKKGGDNNEGIDCYHLAQKVFERYNIFIPDYRDSCSIAFDSNFKSSTIDREIDRKRKNWVKIENPVEPCLVVLRAGSDPTLCTHIGVYIGENKFIHVMKEIKSAIERVDHPIWVWAIEGYYIYNG